MGRRLFTSDLHFNHPKVAKIRGFTKDAGEPHVHDEDGTFEGCPGCFAEVGDTVAHDEAIVARWNKAVHKDDLVFILGDVAMNWKGVEDRLAQMRGRKVLITGNHDIFFGAGKGWRNMGQWIGKNRFEAIIPLLQVAIGGRKVLLSHFPYEGDHVGDKDRHTQFRPRDEGLWLLHGHIHARTKLGNPRMIWAPPTGDPNYLPMHRGRQIHIGVDAWDLKPVAEEEIVPIMAEEERKYLISDAERALIRERLDAIRNA